VPVFTSGHTVLTPVTIKTNASLEQIRAAMLQAQYKGQVPGSGWGSVDDDDDVLRGRALGRPSGGVARIDPVEGEWKRRLMARFYWNPPNNELQAVLSDDIDDRVKYDFKATDIMVVPTDRDAEFLAWIGMRPTAVGYTANVVENLRVAVQAADQGGTIQTAWSPAGFAEDDLFRWILYRHLWQPTIGVSETPDRLELKAINDISGRDGLSRGAALSRGADIDRPELLALLAGAQTFFGPAKLRIYDNYRRLDATFELRQDGGFSPVAGACRYTEGAPAAERAALVNDLAFGILPTLRSAYYADDVYRDEGKDRLLVHSRERLGRALGEVLSGQECPICGNLVP
jgi:hypothetical protein